MADNKITIGGVLIYTTLCWGINASMSVPEDTYNTLGASVQQEGFTFDSTDIFNNYSNREDLKIEKVNPNKNILSEFIGSIIEKTIPLDKHISKLVDDNFWNLI